VVDKKAPFTPPPLKAVILAAGAKSITDDGLPVLLQDLAVGRLSPTSRRT
jgi:hypothetical protein